MSLRLELPIRVAAITGLDSPESVLYDPEQDVYFIASMVGFGSVKFGAAHLSRADAGDPTRIEPFAVAGRGEMRLDAPKGMALQGDTLWVADIALLRALDRRTGAPLATVGLAGHGVVLLNDLALGSDGALYTTDSGLEMSPEGVIYHPGTSKVLAMRSDGSVSRMPGTPTSGHLNGLVLDEAGRHRIAVTFDAFQSSVLALRLAPRSPARARVPLSPRLPARAPSSALVRRHAPASGAWTRNQPCPSAERSWTLSLGGAGVRALPAAQPGPEGRVARAPPTPAGALVEGPSRHLMIRTRLSRAMLLATLLYIFLG